MSDRATQLVFEVHKGQSQFAYFLLGVAASATAFAVHETAGAALADTPWPLGLAVVLWAASFAIGCFGIDARQEGLVLNASFLQLTRGIPSGPTSDELAKVLKEMRDDVAKALKRPVNRFRLQKWVLFAGALAYIGGHVMQMAATPSKSRLSYSEERGQKPRATQKPSETTKMKAKGPKISSQAALLRCCRASPA